MDQLLHECPRCGAETEGALIIRAPNPQSSEPARDVRCPMCERCVDEDVRCGEEVFALAEEFLSAMSGEDTKKEAQNERTDIKWNPVMMVVEGHRYRLLEKLGYQHSLDVREVETEDGPRIVVRKVKSVVWRFLTPNDRLGQKPEAEND